jgi:hypothetical protein
MVGSPTTMFRPRRQSAVAAVSPSVLFYAPCFKEDDLSDESDEAASTPFTDHYGRRFADASHPGKPPACLFYAPFFSSETDEEPENGDSARAPLPQILATPRSRKLLDYPSSSDALRARSPALPVIDPAPRRLSIVLTPPTKELNHGCNDEETPMLETTPSGPMAPRNRGRRSTLQHTHLRRKAIGSQTSISAPELGTVVPQYIPAPPKDPAPLFRRRVSFASPSSPTFSLDMSPNA